MLCESNPPARLVTVCGKGSLFTQRTRSPRCTVSVCGVYPVASIVTVWVVGAGAAIATVAVVAIIAPVYTSATAAQRRMPHRMAAPRDSAPLSASLAKRGLQLLGMLEVSDE